MSIFISDLHLGNPHSQAGRFYNWISKQDRNQTLYLVGDIIDDHRTKKWEHTHLNVLSTILNFREIHYIAGNHDAWVRELAPFTLGKLQFQRQAFYKTPNGKKYLVIHGDQYDWMMKYVLISSRMIGHSARNWLSNIHTWMNGKHNSSLVEAAKKAGCDGVICGHTHEPASLMIDAVHYLNCGDWLHSCSAVIEVDGKLTLIKT